MRKVKFVPKKGRKVSKNPSEIKEIAGMIAQGKGDIEISQKVSCDPSTIWRLRKKSDVVEMVEKMSLRLMESVPKAIANVAALVERFDPTVDGKVHTIVAKDGTITRVAPPDSSERKLQYAATKDLLTSTGFLAGSNPGIQINKLVVNQQTNIMSPAVLEVLKQVQGVFQSPSVLPMIENEEIPEAVIEKDETP
jgi:hypothetical protein